MEVCDGTSFCETWTRQNSWHSSWSTLYPSILGKSYCLSVSLWMYLLPSKVSYAKTCKDTCRWKPCIPKQYTSPWKPPQQWTSAQAGPWSNTVHTSSSCRSSPSLIIVIPDQQKGISMYSLSVTLISILWITRKISIKLSFFHQLCVYCLLSGKPKLLTEM